MVFQRKFDHVSLHPTVPSLLLCLLFFRTRASFSTRSMITIAFSFGSDSQVVPRDRKTDGQTHRQKERGGEKEKGRGRESRKKDKQIKACKAFTNERLFIEHDKLRRCLNFRPEQMYFGESKKNKKQSFYTKAVMDHS